MMNSIKSLVIIIVVLIVVIIGSLLGYNYLEKQNQPQPITPQDSQHQASDIKTKAPYFSVVDTQGNPITLDDFSDKPTVLNFWATWCGPCKMEMPAFDELYRQYKDDVNFVMINVDGQGTPISDVTAFTEQNGYSFPVYIDTDFSASYTYNARSIPLSVFIDANGNITDTHVGAMNKSTIENYIYDIIEEG